MRTICMIFALMFFLSCTENSDQENELPKAKEFVDSARSEEHNKVEVLEDSVVSKVYPYLEFREILNKSFRKSNCTLLGNHELAGSKNLREYSDKTYYYLALENGMGVQILHGSEVLHCKSMFGELSKIFENSFVWISSEGCGSDENRNWYVFDFNGTLVVSGKVFLYADQQSQTILFKKESRGSEIYSYSAVTDSLRIVAQLDKKETSQDNYCWKFERKNDKIQGVYDCLPGDTIFIKI